MLGAVAPERWWQRPRQVWRSRQHKVEEARQLGGLLNTLLVSAIAQTFLDQAPADPMTRWLSPSSASP